MADRIWFIASFPSPVIFRYHLPLKILSSEMDPAEIMLIR